MSQSQHDGERNIDQPMIYEIKLQGRLDQSWSSWLAGMAVTYEDDRTVLIGTMTDQAALRGLLNKVWDLNQTLISVNQVESSVSTTPYREYID